MSKILIKFKSLLQAFHEWRRSHITHKIYVMGICTLFLGLIIPGPVGISVALMSIGMFIAAMVWYE